MMKESNLSSSSKTSSETGSGTNSRTNWERLDALTDAEIDTSDSPPLSEEFFAKAKWLMLGESLPRQRLNETVKNETVKNETVKNEMVKVELDLDPKILAWFQSQGQNYERRMLAALRLYAEAHQAVA